MVVINQLWPFSLTFAWSEHNEMLFGRGEKNGKIQLERTYLRQLHQIDADISGCPTGKWSVTQFQDKDERNTMNQLNLNKLKKSGSDMMRHMNQSSISNQMALYFVSLWCPLLATKVTSKSSIGTMKPPGVTSPSVHLFFHRYPDAAKPPRELEKFLLVCWVSVATQIWM